MHISSITINNRQRLLRRCETRAFTPVFLNEILLSDFLYYCFKAGISEFLLLEFVAVYTVRRKSLFLFYTLPISGVTVASL